ncbi:MAG: PHP domain-containing protein, partial [Clostridia bacterium]|nr:PHP domain-containing protein [Clostridia bacterium]
MYTDMFGNTRYKIGLHIHTTRSDGQVTVEEAARIYKDAGFDAIAVTDHWKYHGADMISGLKILPGCEYNLGASDTSVDVMHIVGVGMDTEPTLSKQNSRQEVIDAINEHGAIAILAHPAWSLN